MKNACKKTLEDALLRISIKMKGQIEEKKLPEGFRHVHPHEAIGRFVQKMLKGVVSPYEVRGLDDDIRMNTFEGLTFFEGLIEEGRAGNKLARSPLEHAIIDLRMICFCGNGKVYESDAMIEQLKRRMYETSFAFMNDAHYQKGAREAE